MKLKKQKEFITTLLTTTSRKKSTFAMLVNVRYMNMRLSIS
jgi:hypothetical protein